MMGRSHGHDMPFWSMLEVRLSWATKHIGQYKIQYDGIKIHIGGEIQSDGIIIHLAFTNNFGFSRSGKFDLNLLLSHQHLLPFTRPLQQH